jgi:predicted O-methyltransferase YrrM
VGQIVPDPIEKYLAGLNRLSDEVLAAIAAEGERADLPLIDPEVGALLHVLTLAIGSRRALEIGTAIGYSGTWIARALPQGGMLITFELDPKRSARAKANFARAGVAERTSVMIGDAALLLEKVQGPFDFIFQDGDKRQYESMLPRLTALLRPGGLLVTDNVLWDGEIVPGYVNRPVRDPAETAAIAAYNARLSQSSQLKTIWLPLRDGIAVSIKQ